MSLDIGVPLRLVNSGLRYKRVLGSARAGAFYQCWTLSESNQVCMEMKSLTLTKARPFPPDGFLKTNRCRC